MFLFELLCICWFLILVVIFCRRDSKNPVEKSKQFTTGTADCEVPQIRPNFSSQSIPAAEIVTAVEVVDDVIGTVKFNCNEKKPVTTTGEFTNKSKEKESSKMDETIYKESRRHSPCRTHSPTPMEESSAPRTQTPSPMDLEVPSTKDPKTEVKLDDIKFVSPIFLNLVIYKCS